MGNRIILPSVIKTMTADMQKQFKALRTEVDACKTYIQGELDNYEFKGETATSLKSELQSHITLMTALDSFLAQGITDSEALADAVGFEDLNEKEIEDEIKRLKDKNKELQDTINHYWNAWYRFLFMDIINQYTLMILDNNNTISILEQKLADIERIDAATKNLFNTREGDDRNDVNSTDLKLILSMAIYNMKRSYSAEDNKWNFDINRFEKIKNLKAVEDPQGVRVGVAEKFVQVIDEENDDVYFGGNQGWFDDKDYWTNINGEGCGIIAAVNEYLYMTGRTTITKQEYMDLCYEFANNYPLSHLLMTQDPGLAIGAAPWEITLYLESKLKEDGINVNANWGGTLGNTRDNEYNKMKEMLGNGVPVIWAIYNAEDIGVKFYRYDDEKGCYLDNYTDNGGYYAPSSHYVTVTGIYENNDSEDHKKMIEISSWGRKYYVDYDEYIEATKGTWKTGAINNEFSSIEELEVKAN